MGKMVVLTDVTKDVHDLDLAADDLIRFLAEKKDTAGSWIRQDKAQRPHQGDPRGLFLEVDFVFSRMDGAEHGKLQRIVRLRVVDSDTNVARTGMAVKDALWRTIYQRVERQVHKWSTQHAHKFQGIKQYKTEHNIRWVSKGFRGSNYIQIVLESTTRS